MSIQRSFQAVFSAFSAAFILLTASAAQAEFPETLDGVVFTEEQYHAGLGDFVKTFDVTSELNVSFSGENIILDFDKTYVWPASTVVEGNVNVNTWGFVLIDGTWYASTWEYQRIGQIAKKASAFTGKGHMIFPPLNTFNPVRDEVYGFMVAGITRPFNRRPVPENNNIRERSNIVFVRWGGEVVDYNEIFGGSSNKAPMGAIKLLLLDEDPVRPLPE